MNNRNQTRRAGDGEKTLHFLAVTGVVLMLPFNALWLYNHFIAPVSISHAFPWEVLLWLGGCFAAVAWLVAWTVVAARRQARPGFLEVIEAVILGGLIAYPWAVMMSP